MTKFLFSSKFLTILAVLLLGAALGRFLFQTQKEELKPKITVQIDTLEVEVIVEIPIPYQVIQYKDSIIYQDSIIYLDTPLDIDTLALIRDYYSVKNYRDTLIIDSLITINYFSSITQNKLKELTIGYNLKSYTTTIIPPPINKWELYGGGMLGIGEGSYLNIQIKKSESSWSYIGGVGKSYTGNTNYLIGVNYKIF